MSGEGQLTTASEKRAFLLLAMMKGVGFSTLWQLAEAGRSFGSVVELPAVEMINLLRSKGARLRNLSDTPWHDVRVSLDKSVNQLESTFSERKIVLILRSDEAFPRSLLDLPDPPHWLFVQGNVDVLRLPSIAIVGTRDPSLDGLWLAEYVGLTLALWGLPTVSGLALGIDQLIHTASLTAKVPTIAVLGTGITADYPKNIGPMRTKIVDGGGAIVTEYLPAESYSSVNFVRRNRLQAALARALIPVEWKERSGTAHTVRYAANLGRAIAGLRLPTWNDRRVALPGGHGPRQVFTVPGQDEAFRNFIERSLRDDFHYRQPSFL